MQLRSRRDFVSHLTTLGAVAAFGAGGVATAMEPVRRQGPARLRLSLAAYSFRQYFKHQRDGKPPEDSSKAIDMFQFIDLCAQHGCDGAELTSYYFEPECSTDYLLALRRHAFVRGVSISGTAVGNTFTLPVGDKRDQQIAQTKQWIQRAAVLGAPHIRIFAGDLPAGVSKGQARTLCIGAIEECCAEAAKVGVFLGLENHGGIVAEPDDLLEIVRAVKSPWFGINLDSGNFHTADPYADLARCLPYAVNVQIKVEIQPRGAAKKGPADIPRLAKMLRDGGYQGFVALEYEAAEDPWTAVPRHLAELRAALAA